MSFPMLIWFSYCAYRKNVAQKAAVGTQDNGTTEDSEASPAWSWIPFCAASPFGFDRT